MMERSGVLFGFERCNLKPCFFFFLGGGGARGIVVSF